MRVSLREPTKTRQIETLTIHGTALQCAARRTASSRHRVTFYEFYGRLISFSHFVVRSLSTCTCFFPHIRLSIPGLIVAFIVAVTRDGATTMLSPTSRSKTRGLKVSCNCCLAHVCPRHTPTIAGLYKHHLFGRYMQLVTRYAMASDQGCPAS